jgi:ribosomal protein S18 acetylase RimI-like enzyme
MAGEAPPSTTYLVDPNKVVNATPQARNSTKRQYEPSMQYAIRVLTPDDAPAFRRVRLDALRLHPEAFIAAYEDEVQLSVEQFAERLTTPGLTRFGGFAGEQLVGLVGLTLRSGFKERHKAHLFSMYVDAAHRRSGLAAQLVTAVIDKARAEGAKLLQLSVTIGNTSAQSLYRRLGFTPYGVELRALQIDGRFYDEELMMLDLD